MTYSALIFRTKDGQQKTSSWRPIGDRNANREWVIKMFCDPKDQVCYFPGLLGIVYVELKPTQYANQ